MVRFHNSPKDPGGGEKKCVASSRWGAAETAAQSEYGLRVLKGRKIKQTINHTRKSGGKKELLSQGERLRPICFVLTMILSPGGG